jgi:hypothetical protein
MKTRKTVIAVLTAVLLISAALIVGCISPVDGISFKPDAKGSDFQLPPGKGAVRISLSNSNIRTILPDPDSFDIEDMFFDVQFYTGGPAYTTPSTRFPASGQVDFDGLDDVPIPLAAGSYHILITAYDTDANDASEIPIAGWDSRIIDGLANPYSVTTSLVPVSANLVGFVNGLDEGTFSYDITIPNIASSPPALTTPWGYTTQSLYIYEYTGMTLAVPAITLSVGNNNDDVLLDSGYYIVKIVLTASSCQDRVMTTAMHIYPAMTSKYGTSGSTINVPAPNQNSFTVAFDLKGKTNTNGSYTGGTNQTISNAGLVTNPNNPTSSADDFVSWHNHPTTLNNSTLWTLGSSKVFGDTTLYALWTPKTGPGAKIAIEFSFEDPSTITPTVGSTTFSYVSIDTGGSLELTLSGSYDSIIWKLDGLSIDGLGVSDNVITLDKSTTVDSGTSIMSLLSSGSVMLYVEADDGGTPYSDEILLTVNN